MQKLNIPLARHTKTTRPLRQVVWLLGLCGLVLLFLTWRIGEQWFAREEILEAAPEGTVLSLQLELTGRNWPQIQKLFDNVPLITNRSLDIDDLAPFSKGEMAIFFTETGERAVAIRTDKSKLSENLLSSLAITSQQVAPNIVLLSSTLLPVSGIQSNTHAPLFASLSKRWLGRVELPDMDLSGSFYFYEDDNRFEIVFPNKNGKNIDNAPLPQVMLALTGQRTANQWIGNNHLEAIPGLKEGTWSILVNQNDLGMPELLLSTNKGDLIDKDLLSLVQSAGAYLSPRIKETVLPDGTKLSELIVDPARITVESITLEHIQALRVVNEYNDAVYGAFVNDQLVIATSEAMMSRFQEATDSNSPCIGNTLHTKPEPLLSGVNQQSFQSSVYILQALFSQFSSISLEMEKYSRKVILCST